MELPVERRVRIPKRRRNTVKYNIKNHVVYYNLKKSFDNL